MKFVDLVPFAHYSQKLPSSYLAPAKKAEQVPSWKILSILFIDFMLGTILTYFLTALMTQSARFMLTDKLFNNFNQAQGMNFAQTLIPLMVFSYFFFCFFLNEGQTLGMKFFKKRIQMSTHDFGASFRWAFHSTLTCLSWGLWYFAQGSIWKNLAQHDYLYNTLIEHKDVQSIDLLARIDESASEQTENYWNEAA